MSKPQFTETEQRILALAGDDLDRGPAPFRAIAEAVGVDEEEVLELVRRLKDQGILRRFGATLRHQKAGYGHNAMVAWIAGDRDPDELGRLFASRPEISHVYRRRTYPEWPYDFYTMMHGEHPGDCAKLAEELSRITGITEYTMVNSIKELKKSSMRYFKWERQSNA
ncbi:DNA-binding transcriptional regulator, Lrp family [Paucidesulfovibrio gracilis DSM 16080]|uniref:siroheme decarboxylase n=1 Tax=Paucidesulfovibrio gracilis DSM 16080 TaxID=1121449 RepID=A0A1T4X2B8_9BACT|nr:Lrp/AsnC family transcriptional regulator [Paucidesulfovibrio gracilis]SKA83298.1 DNA-binding transcriptional regulator, Lrp family [Paucidesulfovibrio gracilis DSM 16080]